MNTKKIKTAIIAMLILANMFFIYNLYTLNSNTSRISRQMIDDAITVLRRNGLNVAREAIPDIKPQNYIYEGIYLEETFEEIAKNLSESEISNTFRKPEGMIYNAGEYKFDFGGGTEELPDYFSVSIANVNLLEQDAGYLDYELITEYLIADGLEDYKKMDIAKAENVIMKFLKKHQPGSVNFETIGYQKNTDSEYLVIVQKLDGLAFDSHIVFAEISGEKIYVFKGKWYFGEFTGRYRMPLLDSVNILFKCLEKDGNTIQENEELEKIELYYSIVWHQEDKFYLYPSWRLSFDSGKELSYNTVERSRFANN